MAVWRAMPSPLRLAIVGLGRIATAHVAAIERAGGVVVVAGADPDPAARLVFRGRDLPVVGDPAGLPPVDAAVVTVPTGAHLAVLRELARAGVPEVLMEKPLVATREELRLLDDARGGARVWPLLHFALADEVRWAAERIGAWTAAHGPVAEVFQIFQDPYLPHLGERLRSLHSSWLDSGVNAGVAARLAPLGAVRAAAPSAPAGGHGRRGRSSTWRRGRRPWSRRGTRGAPARALHLRLADGARVLIDHTAGSGLLLRAGRRSRRAVPARRRRPGQHDGPYVAVYGDWRANRAAAEARLDAGRGLVARVLDAQAMVEDGLATF